MGIQASQAGTTFGRLRVMEVSGQSAVCLCACGTTKKVLRRHLLSGATNSCGCAHREMVSRLNKTHGASETLTWKRWRSMINRCYMKNSKSFPDYGGRGIEVCKAWRESYAEFLADMGECPSADLTLDRKDPNGSYEPGNCRWANRVQQNRNSSRNRMLSHDGKTMCVSEWAEQLGINYRTIMTRLNKGWSSERALATPVNTKSRNSRTTAT
ncbi:HNH endonuclease [Pseudomonas chlororaphis]